MALSHGHLPEEVHPLLGIPTGPPSHRSTAVCLPLPAQGMHLAALGLTQKERSSSLKLRASVKTPGGGETFSSKTVKTAMASLYPQG